MHRVKHTANKREDALLVIIANRRLVKPAAVLSKKRFLTRDCHSGK